MKSSGQSSLPNPLSETERGNRKSPFHFFGLLDFGAFAGFFSGT